MIKFTFDQQGIHKWEKQEADLDLTCTKKMDSLAYSDERGYGFISEAGIFPKRKQDIERIEKRVDGFWIQEEGLAMSWDNENHYNYGGMTFRVKLKKGTYKVKVKVPSKISDTNVTMGGMIAAQLLETAPWSAAGHVLRTQSATWKENVWEYTYVLGNQFLDIEVEPKLATKEKPQDIKISVGVSEIQIIPLGDIPYEGDKPTIHLLGDSTVKSYVYEEAPMNGWGQIIGDYFDSEKVEVLNYSQGGRSLKSMYQEGRLNDLLLHGKPGDYILIQSGHNDESREPIKGIEARFGRGNTAETFRMWLETYFLPAIDVRKMKPIFVTCMTRINHEYYSRNDIPDFDDEPIQFDGFKYGKTPGVDFPKLMKEIGKAHQVPVIDLYEMSIEYIQQIGGEAAKAMFLSLEAGETPGKTNTGSYANGNPSQKCDGTHYKECLGKQFARMILTDIVRQDLEISTYLKPAIVEILKKNTDELIQKKLFPEIPQDMLKGKNAYYRNQVEKLIKLGILKLEEDKTFKPKAPISIEEYQTALEKLWSISIEEIEEIATNSILVDNKQDNNQDKNQALTVAQMGHIIYQAYKQKFGKRSNGLWCKPKYMTDYNGVNLSPDDPNYDSNLVGESAQYYPLVPWEQLKDLETVEEDFRELKEELKTVYELGLMRSEKEIVRGKMINGSYLEPYRIVTREKAAKSLYFLFVLVQGIHIKS